MFHSMKSKVMHYECLHEHANGEVTHSYGTVPVYSERHGNEMLHRWNARPEKVGLTPGTKYTYKLTFFGEE